jgi:hypothetical protein
MTEFGASTLRRLSNDERRADAGCKHPIVSVLAGPTNAVLHPSGNFYVAVSS